MRVEVVAADWALLVVEDWPDWVDVVLVVEEPARAGKLSRRVGPGERGACTETRPWNCCASSHAPC